MVCELPALTLVLTSEGTQGVLAPNSECSRIPFSNTRALWASRRLGLDVVQRSIDRCEKLLASLDGLSWAAELLRL
jgi:hypothetical protein